mmetsp:Transcript_3711/g.12240  ORF Transcript_3711/g.12240 Transcript_3711/m.12240 type:complete len:200 (-) Transcript_3711:67-666(-)
MASPANWATKTPSAATRSGTLGLEMVSPSWGAAFAPSTTAWSRALGLRWVSPSGWSVEAPCPASSTCALGLTLVVPSGGASEDPSTAKQGGFVSDGGCVPPAKAALPSVGSSKYSCPTGVAPPAWAERDPTSVDIPKASSPVGTSTWLSVELEAAPSPRCWKGGCIGGPTASDFDADTALSATMWCVLNSSNGWRITSW